MPHKSEINIQIELDDNKIPEKLTWSAVDGGIKNEPTPLLMLNVWDAKTKECLKIDLWTKELPVNELQSFYHQTLIAMSSSYERATSDKKTADFLKEMAEEFSRRMSENGVEN